MAKIIKSNKKTAASFATRRKTYRCPFCGAEVAHSDIDADWMHCRSCGKRCSLRGCIAREEAKKGVGEPPPGVRVIPGVDGKRDPRADLVVYPRRKPAMILFCAWLAGFFGTSAVFAVAPEDFLVSLPLAMLSLLGVAGLVFEIFGKNELLLFADRGVYVARLWRFCAIKKEFSISPETFAFVYEHLSGPGNTVHEVCVETKCAGSVVFGRFLPRSVQRFFSACIARRAAGLALDEARGRRKGLGIRHPVVVAALFAVAMYCCAYAFSKWERILVADGNLVITQTRWWGREVEKTEIPTKDITYVQLRLGSVRGGRNNRLEIQGIGGRVLKELTGFGRDVSGYQIGLMQSLKCRSGTPFDRERYPNFGLLGIGIFLLLPMAMVCCVGEFSDDS